MKSVSEKIEIALKYFNTGKKEEALKNIEILLNSDQQNEELLMLHAKMSLSLGNITSANFSLFQVLEKNQFNAEALKLIYVNFLKIKNMN